MQTSDSHFERRSAERFVVSLPVETDKGAGITRDVSVSGLFVVSDFRLAVGDPLQLGLTMPDRDRGLSVRLGLKGRVVRVEGIGTAQGAGVALEEGNLSGLKVTQSMGEPSSVPATKA